MAVSLTWTPRGSGAHLSAYFLLFSLISLSLSLRAPCSRAAPASSVAGAAPRWATPRWARACSACRRPSPGHAALAREQRARCALRARVLRCRGRRRGRRRRAQRRARLPHHAAWHGTARHAAWGASGAAALAARPPLPRAVCAQSDGGRSGSTLPARRSPSTGPGRRLPCAARSAPPARAGLCLRTARFRRRTAPTSISAARPWPPGGGARPRATSVELACLWRRSSLTLPAEELLSCRRRFLPSVNEPG